MTIVDPMQPMKPRKTRASKATPTTQPAQIQKPQIVSSIAIPTPPSAPAKRSSETPALPRKSVDSKRRWPKIVALILFVAALMVLPELLGQVLLVVYGVLAVFRRYVVGLTFGLAILVLLLSPLFAFITGSSGNGAVLAGYSFGLLLVGFVQLIIEFRRMQRK